MKPVLCARGTGRFFNCGKLLSIQHLLFFLETGSWKNRLSFFSEYQCSCQPILCSSIPTLIRLVVARLLHDYTLLFHTSSCTDSTCVKYLTVAHLRAMFPDFLHPSFSVQTSKYSGKSLARKVWTSDAFWSFWARLSKRIIYMKLIETIRAAAIHLFVSV